MYPPFTATENCPVTAVIQVVTQLEAWAYIMYIPNMLICKYEILHNNCLMQKDFNGDHNYSMETRPLLCLQNVSQYGIVSTRMDNYIAHHR